MAYKPMELRPYLRGAYRQRAANGRCWHFDAWLFYDEADAGALYMATQTREGGRELLTAHSYIVHWRDDGDAALVYRAQIPAHANLVRITDGAMLPLYERLNRMHWSHVVPMAQRRPDAYAYSSVALHYIAAPSLDPLAGAQNYSPWGKA